MLLARLHNGGVSGQRLTDLFGVARSTLLRWGRALKSGDLDRIIVARGHWKELLRRIRVLYGGMKAKMVAEELKALSIKGDQAAAERIKRAKLGSCLNIQQVY